MLLFCDVTIWGLSEPTNPSSGTEDCADYVTNGTKLNFGPSLHDWTSILIGQPAKHERENMISCNSFKEKSPAEGDYGTCFGGWQQNYHKECSTLREVTWRAMTTERWEIYVWRTIRKANTEKNTRPKTQGTYKGQENDIEQEVRGLKSILGR